MKTIKLVLVICLLWAVAAGAVPSVTGQSGEVSDGESIVITGTGFGTKSPAAPKRWVDFDSNGGVDGNPLSEPGWYTTCGDEVPCNNSGGAQCYPEYSMNNSRDGSLVAQFCGNEFPSGYAFQTLRTDGAIITDQKCFVSGKLWFNYGSNYPPASGTLAKVKLMYFFPSTGSYADDPELQIVAEHNGNYGITKWSRYEVYDCGYTQKAYQYNSGMRHQQWNAFAFAFDKGSDGNEDAYMQTMLNYAYRDEGNGDPPLTGAGIECSSGLTMNRFMIGAYLSNAPSNATTVVYYDDVYVDDTWSRAEIGDNPSYYDCNHREMLIPTEWAADEVTATVNVGTFNEGARAWVFVVNSDNEPSIGYEVEIGDGPPHDEDPAPPTGLYATAGVEQATLNWDANTEPDLDGYYVYRHTSSGGPYIPVSAMIPDGTTTFTNTGLSFGQDYYYVVRAVDVGGNLSENSNEASVTPLGDTDPPAAPTGLIGTAGIEEADLSWRANTEQDLAGYHVFRSDISDGGYKPVTTVPISAITYNDSGLTGGRTYFYVVSAVDKAGNGSLYSGEVSVEVLGVPNDPPDPPESVAAVADVEAIDLTWDPNGEGDLAGYYVYWSFDSGGPYDQANTVIIPDGTEEYTHTGLTAGVTYYYVVQAADDSGSRSLDSAEVSAVPDPVPSSAPKAPVGVVGVPGIEEAILSWDANEEGDLDGYYVWRSDVSGGFYSQVNGTIIDEAILTYTDTSLDAGQVYYYVLQAANDSADRSGFSKEVSVTPKADYIPPSVLAPDSLVVHMGQRFNFPVYAHWGWKTSESGVPLSSEDYAHIAQHDVYHLPQEALVDTIYQSVVDSVRVRNPNTVFTVHMQVMGWKPAWENWGQANGSYYKDIYNLAMAHPTWSVRNVNGDYMVGKGYGTIYWNPYAMDEGLNDSLGVIWDKWTTFRDIDRPRVGIFADWIASDFPGWPFPDSLQHMDFDQDGIPHGTSPDAEWIEDEAKYDARNIDLARGFRDNIAEPTFLMVPNVLNGKTSMAINNGYLWDGMMFEGFQYYEPSTSLAAFKQAVTEVHKGLNDSRVSPPLVFWQGLENTTLTSIEIIGPIMRGLSVFHHHRGGASYEDAYTLPDDLNLGRMVGEPTWDGDVVTAHFTSNEHDTTAKLLFVEATGGNTLPWDCIVFTSTGTVLRRYGDWPDYASWPGY